MSSITLISDSSFAFASETCAIVSLMRETTSLPFSLSRLPDSEMLSVSVMADAFSVAEVAICPPGAVQAVNGQRSILLHDRFLPIFRLVDLLHLPVAETRPARDISVVVCEHDGQRIGVEVAAILRRADLLIQEMHPRIAHLPGIGGISTIGADKIVIAVDPDGLFALARQAAVFGLRAHEERVREGLF